MNIRIAFVAFLLLFSQLTYAQSTTKTTTIAPFKIFLTNGLPYSYTQLAKGPVVLIYFSPECEHCQKLTEDLVKNYSVIANKQVVMISFLEENSLKQFVQRYRLQQFSNIKVGTERKPYIVPPFYKIASFPYIAIYDKNGNLAKTFEGEDNHKIIFDALKKI